MEVILNLNAANAEIPTMSEGRPTKPVTEFIEFPQAPDYRFRWYFWAWQYEQRAQWRRMDWDPETGDYTIPVWFTKDYREYELHENCCPLRQISFAWASEMVYTEGWLWTWDPTANVPAGNTITRVHDFIPLGTTEIPLVGNEHAPNPYCPDFEFWVDDWGYHGAPMARVYWEPYPSYYQVAYRRAMEADLRPPIELFIATLGAAMGAQVFSRRKRI